MLVHRGTQKIETERFILLKFKPSDSEYMFKNWATDSEVCKFLSWNPHSSLSETEQVVENWVNGYVYDNCYNWTIELKEIGQIIGQISIMNLSERYYSCEVAYNIGRSFWGKEIMSEALRAVIIYMIKDIGINRLEAKHDTKNPASGRVMQKSGMKYEGIMRQEKIQRESIFKFQICQNSNLTKSLK